MNGVRVLLPLWSVLLGLMLSACGGGGGGGDGGGEPARFRLDVAASGVGEVTSGPQGIACGTACVADFNIGTVVTLTAASGPGHALANWGGACTGTAPTCTVPMTQARSVTASFVAVPVPRYTLGVVVSTGGRVTSQPAGIDCGSQCSVEYTAGTAVTLTAAPAAGRVFSGWSGACSGSALTCTVAMTEARSVNASFVQAPPSSFSLSVERAGEGAVISQPAGIDCGTRCTASFNTGASVTLQATASAGQRFIGWTGDCTGSAATCTLAMTGDRSAKASFGPIAGWNVAVPISAGGAGDVRVAIDDAGNALAVWTQFAGTQERLLASRYAPDNGWSAPVTLDLPPTEVASFNVAMDRSTGRAIVALVALTTTGFYDVWAAPNDPLTGWGAATRLENADLPIDAVSGGGAAVAIDAAGRAIVVWAQRDAATTNHSIWASRFVPGGGWAAATLVEQDVQLSMSNPVITMAPNGDASIVWVATSLLGSERSFWTNRYSPAPGWGSAQRLVEGFRNQRPLLSLPSLATDGSGNALLAWANTDPGNSGQRNVTIAVKRLSGGAWQSGQTDISPPNAPGSLATSSRVRLALSPQGAGLAAWRLDSGEIFAAHLVAGGAWSGRTALVPTSNNATDGQLAVAVDDQGNGFVAWAQRNAPSSPRDVWLIGRSTTAGWGLAAVHDSNTLDAIAPALAMNGQGLGVIGWNAVTENVGTQVFVRVYRPGN